MPYGRPAGKDIYRFYITIGGSKPQAWQKTTSKRALTFLGAVSVLSKELNQQGIDNVDFFRMAGEPVPINPIKLRRQQRAKREAEIKKEVERLHLLIKEQREKDKKAEKASESPQDDDNDQEDQMVELTDF